MLEKQLIRAIDKYLPKEIHRQSMTGAAVTGNGIPDRYYDGPLGDLWVEYKQLKTMPRSGVAIGAYTELQLHWMERRYRYAQHRLEVPNVLGVVGLPNKTAVIQRTPHEWRNGTHINTSMTHKEVALCLSGMLSAP